GGEMPFELLKKIGIATQMQELQEPATANGTPLGKKYRDHIKGGSQNSYKEVLNNKNMLLS
ncbi:MAG: hypothetical protein M1470_14425, partial [Bacteroidetes bacterium]|nr:hypothetical protein [Bacteroidota bacterium]